MLLRSFFPQVYKQRATRLLCDCEDPSVLLSFDCMVWPMDIYRTHGGQDLVVQTLSTMGFMLALRLVAGQIFCFIMKNNLMVSLVCDHERH